VSNERTANGKHAVAEPNEKAAEVRPNGKHPSRRPSRAKPNGKHASAQDRARREPPARTGPKRALSNAFRPATAASAIPEPDARRAVENAVDTAYRICEDYLSWGRNAASSRSPNDARHGVRGEEWREHMKRHPYAMGGMYNPLIKFWQEMAGYWMNFAPHPYGSWGGPSHDDRSAGPGYESGGPRDWCGPRGDDAQRKQECATASSLKRVLVKMSAESSTVTATINTQNLSERLTGKVWLTSKTAPPAQIEVEIDQGELSVSLPNRLQVGEYKGFLFDDDGREPGIIEVKVE
jgi:hypothetical protein